jgi:hypothetical protein
MAHPLLQTLRAARVIPVVRTREARHAATAIASTLPSIRVRRDGNPSESGRCRPPGAPSPLPASAPQGRVEFRRVLPDCQIRVLKHRGSEVVPAQNAQHYAIQLGGGAGIKALEGKAIAFCDSAQ